MPSSGWFAGDLKAVKKLVPRIKTSFFNPTSWEACSR